MYDREKVIKAYEDFVNGYECFCASDDYEYEMHKAVLALLKEQDAQKFFVDESGKITPLPVAVRCKDCKYDALLKEQEETELCDRCGRRRLKSNREGGNNER